MAIENPEAKKGTSSPDVFNNTFEEIGKMTIDAAWSGIGALLGFGILW